MGGQATPPTSENTLGLEEPEYQLAPGSTPRITWPAGPVGIGSLPLVFTPGGGGGR